jgi:hypothetical protein
MTYNRIIQNAARCNKCHTIIVSTSTYDFNRCKCGSIGVDGGKEYCKMMISGDADYTNLNLVDTSTEKEIQQRLVWGTRGKSGEEELEYKFLIDLDTDHLVSISKTQTQIPQLYKLAIKKELRIRKIKDFL